MFLWFFLLCWPSIAKQRVIIRYIVENVCYIHPLLKDHDRVRSLRLLVPLVQLNGHRRAELYHGHTVRCLLIGMSGIYESEAFIIKEFCSFSLGDFLCKRKVKDMLKKLLNRFV